jgi:hypothetical protein
MMSPEKLVELERLYTIMEQGSAPLSALLQFRRTRGLPELPELVARASAVPPVPARPRGVTKLREPGQQFQVAKRREKVSPSQRFDPADRYDTERDLFSEDRAA